MNAASEKTEFLVWPTAREREFRHEGNFVTVPENWVFVPSGDPGLTRRIKGRSDYWVVVRKRKNRLESLGVWSDRACVEAVRTELAAERALPAYREKLAAACRRRDEKQAAYTVEFQAAVEKFLAFSPRYAAIGKEFARIVTAHAIPVGSGTVARTERIPLAARAEAAVIAWMRHQTTVYDQMKIPNVKGERRAVRKMLADRSRDVLARYRTGEAVPADCPLRRALENLE